MKAVLFNNEIIGFVDTEKIKAQEITNDDTGDGNGNMTAEESEKIALRDSIMTVWARFMNINGPTFVFLDVLPVSCKQWAVGTYLVRNEGGAMILHRVVEVELKNWAFTLQKKLRSEYVGTISTINVAQSFVHKTLAQEELSKLKDSFAQLTITCDEIAKERDDAIEERDTIEYELAEALKKIAKYKTAMSDLLQLYNAATRQQMHE